MERVTTDVEAFHLSVADFDAFFVDPGVEDALDFEAGLGRGRRDELDHGGAIRERPAAPVLRDAAEQAMLDLVPFRRARRIVPDLDREARLVREILQLHSPEPQTIAVRAAAIRRDGQLAHLRIARPADPFEPGADGRHRELGRVVRDADADPARICGNVIHAVGRDLAELLILEIVHFHALGIALGPPIATGVAVVADELFLLRVNGDHGLARCLGGKHFSIDVFELRVAIGVARAVVGFPVDLPRETDLGQQLAHAVGADRVAHGGKRGRQLVETLRHPQQRTDRITQRCRLDQAFEIIEQRRVTFGQWSRAAAFTANLPRGKRRRIDVFQATLDGAARQPRDARYGRETTPSRGAHLARGEQPPTALVPLRAVRFPSLPNRLPVDHANAGNSQRAKRRSLSTESHCRGEPGIPIHLSLRLSLVGAFKMDAQDSKDDRPAKAEGPRLRGPTLEATRNSKIDATGAVIPDDLPFQLGRADDGSIIDMPGLVITRREDGTILMMPGAIPVNRSFPPPTGEFSSLSNDEMRDRARAAAASLRDFQNRMEAENRSLPRLP